MKILKDLCHLGRRVVFDLDIMSQYNVNSKCHKKNRRKNCRISSCATKFGEKLYRNVCRPKGGGEGYKVE